MTCRNCARKAFPKLRYCRDCCERLFFPKEKA